MKPNIGKAFSFWMVGALALVALLAPTTSAAAQGTGTVTAHARYCTGLSYQGLMGEVGPDCVTGSAAFTFYLHGDGTDDNWTLNVGESGAASMELQAGKYDVWTPGGPIFVVHVPDGGATSFTYGFPVAAPPAPAPDPVPPAPDPVAETAVLNVNTYACTGVVGAPIALVDIGSDCTRIATNLDFYLWGDGTDDHWNLTTSASGPVSITLQIGGYEVLNTSTWERLGAQLPSGGATLSIGYAAVAVPAPVETGELTVYTYSCTGVTGGAIVLNGIGPDCVRVSANLDFYLWGDGTDDHWRVTTSATAPVTAELLVGDYLVIDNPTWLRADATVVESGGTLSIGFPASYGHTGLMATP